MDTLKVSEDGIGTTRVLWIDEAGRVNDKWDVYLLDAANEATAWLTARSLALCANQLNASVCQLGRETTTSELTVGLCMSTRDRLWQLQRALPFNILQTWPHRNWCHIYVVDCGGADGTLEWMKTNCRSAIDVGLLTIYQASHKDFPHWHASVGKNCAADVATEHILVNVDSDSIVGPDFVVDVVDRFSYGSTKGFNMVLHYEGVDGTCGRIACTRKDFHKIRGYDEDAHPMGAHDIDLIYRIRALPEVWYERVGSLPFSQAIPNTLDEKVQACDQRNPLNWDGMDARSSALFAGRRKRQPDVRNQHKETIGVLVESANPQDQQVPIASGAQFPQPQVSSEG